jgi:hypothetical protein
VILRSLKIIPSRVKPPYFGQRGKGSTAVAMGPYTSCPNNLSATALVHWALKMQYCFKVTVRVSVKSDVIFSLTKLRFRNQACV